MSRSWRLPLRIPVGLLRSSKKRCTEGTPLRLPAHGPFGGPHIILVQSLYSRLTTVVLGRAGAGEAVGVLLLVVGGVLARLDLLPPPGVVAIPGDGLL